MDWTQIIVALIAAVFGGALSAFIIKMATLQSTKKKANAEADDAAVEPLKKAIDILNNQLADANAKIEQKDAIIASLMTEKTNLTARLAALYDDMCVHKGCKLRKPHQGQGQKWYDSHADDPSFGCDFMSVEWLLKLWRKNNSEADVSSSD